MALAGAASGGSLTCLGPRLFYTSWGFRLVDMEAYDAACGYRTPIEQEIDCEKSTEAKIRRWQIQWSHLPDHLCRLQIDREIHKPPVELIDENGGGPGIRLRKRHQKKT
jgi:hypothetical protein